MANIPDYSGIVYRDMLFYPKKGNLFIYGFDTDYVGNSVLFGICDINKAMACFIDISRAKFYLFRGREKMKIYMISPTQEMSFWGFEKAVAWQGYQINFMPLGIITVAAIAETMGHEVIVRDARFQDIDYDTDADMVCVSFYNVQKDEAFRIAKEFKKKGKYIVFGGAYPLSSQEECKKYADTLILGEGEESFRLFLEDFEKKEAKETYESTKIDMHKSPIPAYHLLDLKKYRNAGINFSRGCPFNCEFCDIKEEWFNGRIPRTKKPEQVLKELEMLKKYKVKNVFFHDDNFIAIPHKTKELLRAIIRWQKENNYHFDFGAEASLNIAHDEELLDLFKKSNFASLFVGIETPNIESLKITNKNQNTIKNIFDDIINIQKKGITLSAGMITGFDGDRRDIFEKMYNFIQKTGITITSLGPLVIFPKTPLETRMKKEGRLLDKETYHPAFMHEKHKEVTVNYIPKHMTGKELVQGTNWVLKKIYSHKGYGERFLNQISNMKEDYNNTLIQGKSDVTTVSFTTKIKFIKDIFFGSPTKFYYNTLLLFKVVILNYRLLPLFFKNLAMHDHVYSYYKKIIGDPDKVGKCPVKLNDDEKCSIAVSKLSKIVEEMPNPAEPIDKNINMLCDMLEDIGKCITKENIIKLKDGCVSRLKKIKSLNLGESIKEKQLLKEDLNKLLTVVKYCS